MYTNDDAGDLAMDQAYHNKRVIRMRPVTSPEPKPASSPQARRKLSTSEIVGGIIAAPFIGGILVIIFGLMVWAAVWIWGKVL